SRAFLQLRPVLFREVPERQGRSLENENSKKRTFVILCSALDHIGYSLCLLQLLYHHGDPDFGQRGNCCNPHSVYERVPHHYPLVSAGLCYYFCSVSILSGHVAVCQCG